MKVADYCLEALTTDVNPLVGVSVRLILRPRCGRRLAHLLRILTPLRRCCDGLPGKLPLCPTVRHHRNHSTLLTSNRPIEEWGLFWDTCLPPRPSWTVFSSRPKSSRSPVAAIACGTHKLTPPLSPRRGLPTPTGNPTTPDPIRNDENSLWLFGKVEPYRTSWVGGRARAKMGPQAHAAGLRLTLAHLPADSSLFFCRALTSGLSGGGSSPRPDSAARRNYRCSRLGVVGRSS